MMRPHLLRRLVALLGLGLVAVGIAALLVPGLAAAVYGVDATTLSARIFVRAAGVRDLAIGGILLGLLARRIESRALGIAVLGTTLVPIVDSLNVLQGSGLRLAVILHAGSILPIVFLAIALILVSLEEQK